MLQDGASPSKEEIKAFKKGMEDAFLLSSVLSNGQKVRSGLEAVSDVSKLIIGYAGPECHLQETKYMFMKDALTMKRQGPDHDAELRDAFDFVQNFANYKGRDGQQVLHTQAIEMKNVLLGHAEKMFKDLQETFQSKLESVLVEVVMPDELETLTSEQITETFLNTHFPWIRQSTSARKRWRWPDASSSFIDMPMREFLEVQKYEMNHRSCLQYLCLWPFKSKHTALFTFFLVCCYYSFLFSTETRAREKPLEV